MHLRRRTATAVIALLAALVAIGVHPTPAAAAACTYSACNGRDPQSTGCAVGARTIADFESEQDGFMYVELRYSPTCHAAWARSTVAAPGMMPHAWLVLYGYHSSSGGSAFISYWKKITNSSNDTGASGTVKWTYMQSYGDWVQACLKNIYEEGPCTARR
jgi:hypothetical protein